ncbi:hypothetical protein chiPu_0027493 [Chiloscyllium punctatum]|uniref:Uncharacterized protein n=1 Tax=Chiloscyllium punctatum TaxID=137246 RepID=A0A401TL40_CHIPU|nr:hypothetical protein [Chiloscyllium punctatum]
MRVRGRGGKHIHTHIHTSHTHTPKQKEQTFTSSGKDDPTGTNAGARERQRGRKLASKRGSSKKKSTSESWRVERSNPASAPEQVNPPPNAIGLHLPAH